ncbi:MAG TPA: hypothetical protein VHL58_17680 [Thermoanaerobaculia bacterium]|nr:hypothetical protein [Thermoanaerobaculia bacterium]
MKKIIPILLIIAATSARAQGLNPSDYEKVLLPILIQETPGAFGSRFISSFFAYNDSDARVGYYPSVCSYTCPLLQYLAAKSEAVPALPTASPTEAPGLLLYVERTGSNKVSFNLRVQDLSRQALTWGTDLPVVREESFYTGKIQLLNIPLDERFRQTVRVYDVDATGSGAVTLRAFDAATGEALGMTVLSLPVLSQATPPSKPGFGQLFSLSSTFPGITGHDRIRLEIESATPGLRYWAFATITNRETQHITTITPQ